MRRNRFAREVKGRVAKEILVGDEGVRRFGVSGVLLVSNPDPCFRLTILCDKSRLIVFLAEDEVLHFLKNSIVIKCKYESSGTIPYVRFRNLPQHYVVVVVKLIAVGFHEW